MRRRYLRDHVTSMSWALSSKNRKRVRTVLDKGDVIILTVGGKPFALLAGIEETDRVHLPQLDQLLYELEEKL